MTTRKPAAYVVAAETLAGHAPGDEVTAETLEADGIVVAHLVAGGHIKPKTTTKKKAKE